MTTPTPLERAAELLRGYAHELQEGQTSRSAPDDWTGEDEAKAAYDEHLAVADALEREHARVQELERERDNYKLACDEWAEKTDWVQRTAQPGELGKHRADVLRERIWRAISAEREDCAQVCEERAGSCSLFMTTREAWEHAAHVRGCAAAIRARGAQGEIDG